MCENVCEHVGIWMDYLESKTPPDGFDVVCHAVKLFYLHVANDVFYNFLRQDPDIEKSLYQNLSF